MIRFPLFLKKTTFGKEKNMNGESLLSTCKVLELIVRAWPWRMWNLVYTLNAVFVLKFEFLFRFLASLVKKPEFIPTDHVKAALADAIHETSQDLAMIMPIVNLGNEEDWAAQKEDYFETTLPGRNLHELS